MALAVAVFALLAPPGAGASQPPDFAALAQTPRWQALLHINHGATLRDIGSSYVDDPAFFLAATGKHDPVAELRATRKALAPAASPTRCRFPARYWFLAKHLGWAESAPLAHCADYLAWREHMPLGQLVLVFPAAYLNSPSSMFGHTLLRLDPVRSPDTTWLSRAITFGAYVAPTEGSFSYVWRGIITGYPAGFTVTSYFEKLREYAHLENRDLWEYVLNLDREELEWLVRHLWELNGINFDYYFFDENCSFRLLELIEVARPSLQLTDDFRVAELPVNTVRALLDAGLVVERHYVASKANQLHHLSQTLTAKERAIAQALVADPRLAASARFGSQPPQRRHLIALVAYEALRLGRRDQPREATAARTALALLRVVQANPAPELADLPAPPAPETGHGTQMASVGAGRRADVKYVQLGYRLTYHDVFDPLTGFLRGAGIEGLDIALRYSHDEGLQLESLDLVNIRSLSPRRTFVKPISWYVHGGLEQAHVRGADDRRLTTYIDGGAGASWRMGPVLPYALAVTRAETASGVDPAVALGLGAELGVIYATYGAQLGLSTRYLAFDNNFYRQRTRATVNLPVSPADALRVQCAHRAWRGGDEAGCSVSLRHFFD